MRLRECEVDARERSEASGRYGTVWWRINVFERSSARVTGRDLWSGWENSSGTIFLVCQAERS